MEIENILRQIETEIKLRGFSAKTVKMYILYNKQFLERKLIEPQQVTEADIKQYLAEKMTDAEMATMMAGMNVDAQLAEARATLGLKGATVVKRSPSQSGLSTEDIPF